jgi:pimeloyl-ACP methyl ester carboxylesterase
MDTRAVYQPKKTSRSEFIAIRGLKYHVRHWGREGAPRLFMLHGSRDISASWQFTVDISLHYAGLRPSRVRKFVNIEGYMIGNLDADYSHKRLDRWLSRVEKGKEEQPRFPSLQDFHARLMKGNPRLAAERALWLSREWCLEQAGGSVLQRIDPQQRRGGLYYFAEGLECWKRITAPMLLIEGGRSNHLRRTVEKGDYELRINTLSTKVGVERFEEAGHNVHLDEPERLAEVSEQFLLQT